MKAKTICLMNNKGGVGKSTSAGAFAGIFSELEKKVLIIDCDPQGNCSQLFQMYRKTEHSIIDLFLLESTKVTKDEVKKYIYETSIRNIDIISSNEDFTFTCDEITRDNTRIQQLVLKKALSTIKSDYDFIIIDTSPFYNIISINALCASDYVITPVESDGFGYRGLVQLLKKIYNIKSELNEDLQFLGVFLNKLQISTNIAKDLYNDYLENIHENFIPVYIRQDNQAKESATAFIPLSKYNPRCSAIKDYKKLIADLNILDTSSQMALVEEVNKIYNQEIKEIKSHMSEKKSEASRFQLNILQHNMLRISKEVSENGKAKI